MSLLNRDPKSFIVTGFTALIEFGNHYFTLASWLFRYDKNIFKKVEIMMITLTLLCIWLLLNVHNFTGTPLLLIELFMAQRVLEYLIVYSRSFILNRGRIFTDFHHDVNRGEWLIVMFFMSLTQVTVAFATWYRIISLRTEGAFTVALDTMDSFYFSVMTFLTVGYGDITPVTTLAKSVSMFQGALYFYTLLIVLNGLISMHFLHNK